jgi:acid-sensing ion channel, other
LIAVIIIFSGGSYLIGRVYQKWQNHPVIVSFDEQTTSISTIPFSAVTFCPENKFKSSMFNLSNTDDPISKLTEQQKTFQNALYPICPEIYPIPPYSTQINYPVELKKIAIPFKEIFNSCMWKGFAVNCEDFFSEIRKY